ncbi:MAG TPA: lysylphosphatidylglycerol synthase transmembrane domain-containing protein [Gaiellaceae bacterium]|nr:lysylphosphatidylglycerol synthase transmembrane domain-containing protein [Gaiellaceae bacterium]
MDDVRAFLDASEAFFEALAAVAWGALALAVLLHVLRLVFRVRGWQNIIRAAYPGTRVRYRSVFGAYMAGVGVNAIVPARGGDVVKLYLAKHRVESSTYPTLTSSLVVETLFDFVVAIVLFLWAIQMGLLPGVPDLPRIPAFDWTFVVEHPRIAAFLGCVLLGALILLIGWASQHVTAFREKVAQGFAILHDRRVYLRQVVSWQAASWLARIGSTFFFLRAFHVDATAETTLAVLVVGSLSTVLPFTPGGAGTQQAILVFALAGAASSSSILAFSFGQQLVVTIVNVAIGFAAILLMLGTLRWRGHVRGAEAEIRRSRAGEDPIPAPEEDSGQLPAGEPSRSAPRA